MKSPSQVALFLKSQVRFQDVPNESAAQRGYLLFFLLICYLHKVTDEIEEKSFASSEDARSLMQSISLIFHTKGDEENGNGVERIANQSEREKA